jgi:peptidoglycan/LPS O-acetylase OafA/YrhL
MISDYPVAPITVGIAVAFFFATLAGTVAARAGFPLRHGERIGRLDGLRGYLALSVLAHHFIIWLQITRLGGSWSAPSINFFNNLGVGGVALFFMTTGCVFYPRVIAGFRATSWMATYTARIFRIVPLVIVSVAIITAVIVLRTGHRIDSLFLKAAAVWIACWGEPPLLGYADSGRLNAYVLWSLHYEWLFYLFVLPACAFGMDLIRNRLPSWILPAGLLLISLALKGLLSLGGLTGFLPLFAVGMLGFECQRREAVRRILESRLMSIPALGCLVIGMISTATPYGATLILSCGFFFICVACGNDLAGLLRTRGSLVLGECSYGIYLLHGIVLSLLFVDGKSAIASLSASELPTLLPLVAICVTGITGLTYLLVERPAIRAASVLIKLSSSVRLRTGSSQLDIAQ